MTQPNSIGGVELSIEEDKSDKSHRAAASQFFVAAELCRRGLVAVITMGNCPNTDILVSNKSGTSFAHVQVKTYIPGIKTCSVGRKAERPFGPNIFWILAGIPTASCAQNEYLIIPAGIMAHEVSKVHKLWLDTPGKKGQPHNNSNVRAVQLPPLVNPTGWDLQEYRNRWDLIEKVLIR